MIFEKQLSLWPEARQRFADLETVRQRTLNDGSAMPLVVQFNPARIVSTGAKIDKKSLEKRPCFLCRDNRPKEQLYESLNYSQEYEFLVNPFPILKRHFTIPARQHQLQDISGVYMDFYQLLNDYPDLLVFYNGPTCGASCPDHLHFQAGESGVVPLQRNWNALTESLTTIVKFAEGSISSVDAYPCPALLVCAHSKDEFASMFAMVKGAMAKTSAVTGKSLDMNILAWKDGEDSLFVIIPRGKHRPDCYPDVLVSPGALDMGGLIITPREEDFLYLNAEKATEILKEVAVDSDVFEMIKANIRKSNMPKYVSVGIMSAEEICFSLCGDYILKDTGKRCTNIESSVEIKEGKIIWNGEKYTSLSFCPENDCTQNERQYFTLEGVTIGVNFHWQRKERQSFLGELRFIVHEGKICAINILDIEDYLASVISSEMSATSSLELLKAHAVISRSWLINQIIRRKSIAEGNMSEENSHAVRQEGAEDEIIRWYDREDHTLFDVCADDHCQRYQGITKQTSPLVQEAIDATRGQVLVCGDEICDARFSKCCGGVTEEYGYCWENIKKPYLLSFPDPYCNTNDSRILRQVLNDFDQSTHDFYRWTVEISSKKIRQLLHDKLNVEIGDIIDLQAVERGPSGRISRLRFVGTESSIIIGKELEIRRALSDTHLYSSAFDVEKSESGDSFILHGKGWGHGVGLCQIGAAVMGENGFTYEEILSHYYKNTEIYS